MLTLDLRPDLPAGWWLPVLVIAALSLALMNAGRPNPRRDGHSGGLIPGTVSASVLLISAAIAPLLFVHWGEHLGFGLFWALVFALVGLRRDYRGRWVLLAQGLVPSAATIGILAGEQSWTFFCACAAGPLLWALCRRRRQVAAGSPMAAGIAAACLLIALS